MMRPLYLQMLCRCCNMLTKKGHWRIVSWTQTASRDASLVDFALLLWPSSSMAECPPEQENEESRAALRFLKKCRKDMQLWKLLVSKPFVAKRLCDSLAAEVKSDQAFAAAVAAIAPSSHPKKVKRRNSEAPASLGSAWPPKSRRRLCYKQGPSGYWRIEGIGCLNVNLMAHILSFADLGSKLSGALRVAKGFHEVLQVGAAWDPLVVDQQHCRGMLHLLRAMSVFSALGESVQPAGRFPGGFFESSKVEIVLMDPEKPLRDLDSDTEEDEPRARRPLKILCPMREFGRGWHFFKSVSELTLKNIDSFTMSFDFVNFRCVSLQKFGMVKCEYAGNRRYSLYARKNEPPPLVDCSHVATLNSNRIPRSVRRLSTTLSEREALFLLEHSTAFKNGNDMRFTHDRFMMVTSHEVRKKYKEVVKHLREQFAGRFPGFEQLSQANAS
ncbi:unnamed protein product [Durusdinium trenchii]|uniref:Uncharacterized protein n=2 Tax=Durusdinium trenchii TaxID=1381693 RepID=A0ABP0P5U5_9DINO